MKVPFLDLKSAYSELKTELDAAYLRFMDSGWYVLGTEAELFEMEFARFCGTKHCVGVSSGLEALRISLEAAGIQAMDEVIVPSNTYIATWLAVSQLGAVPVPVEPEMDSYNLNPALLEQAVTTKTKAIVPVHLYGRPVDMKPVMEIAQKHRLFVLEDNAQSQGAIYKGQRTGALGHAAAISFYPGKNLGAFGEAGAVVSNDPEFMERIRVLRNYGSKEKYQNEVKGYNSRIDSLQCAFLREKMKVLDEWNRRRAVLANRYGECLAGMNEITLPKGASGGIQPVWHQYIIRTSRRDELQTYLKQAGVGTMIHYPIPPHRSEAFVEYSDYRLPIAEELSETVLSLPISPHHSLEEIDYVIECIHNFYGD